MVTLSTSELSSALLLALIVLLVGRRAVAMARGTPVSVARLVLTTLLFLLLFAFLAVEELFLLPVYAVAADVAVVGIVGVLAVPFVERRVTVYRDPVAGWSFRLGLVVPALYLGLFALRFALDFVVVGEDPFGPPVTSVSLSPVALVTLAIVDALFAASAGLLVARSAGIYRAYRTAVRAAGPDPTA